MRRFTQHKILRRDRDAVFLEAFHLADETDRIEHHAIADDTQFVFAQDAGGDQMQHRLLAFDDDRMTGVVAAGVAHDDARRLREHVNDFAFAFVTPLGADQNCVCHKFFASRATLNNKNPRTIIRGKAAGSLPVEARKLRQECQFNNASESHISTAIAPSK